MPCTEIVTPYLKQDARDASLAQWPLSMKIVSAAPGAKKAFCGLMIRENNINVEASFKFAFSLEWESYQHFSFFLASDEFKGFIGAGVKPFTIATIGPPNPQSQTQLYETDVGPVAVNSAPITEVFRISLEDVTKEIEVKKAWMVLVNALVHAGTAVPRLSGKSVNLNKSLYLGVFGWESLEGCDKCSFTFNTANILRNMIRHIRNSMYRVQGQGLKLSEASAPLW